MDDYTKALIRYRFEDLCRLNHTDNANRGIYNWIAGYLVALDDMGIITSEESAKAVKALIAWYDEQKAKDETLRKEAWNVQDFCVAEVVEDGND